MPELAEVEYYRKRWEAGRGKAFTHVHLNRQKRVFRGTDVTKLETMLPGRTLIGSEAAGKQMLFRFSGDLWLGIHLGMTGKLKAAPADYIPEPHDHLVLFQERTALVFNDMRQFGRVLFHAGKDAPYWWARIPPAVHSDAFTLPHLRALLRRHPKLAIKPALLLQHAFPGVGNWMADEILWRAGIQPARRVGSMTEVELRSLWRQARFVCKAALEKIGADFSDPPRTWLFHQRWNKHGICPKHKTPLRRQTIGGRTTAWCPLCQGTR